MHYALKNTRHGKNKKNKKIGLERQGYHASLKNTPDEPSALVGKDLLLPRLLMVQGAAIGSRAGTI